MNPILVEPPVFKDKRGLFCKTWHPDLLARHGIRMTIAEEFHTLSGKNVLRGMHFQTPPHQHSKLVYCPVGRVLDVVVDLRKDSGTFGRHWSWELSQENQHMVFIPEGFAHGFLSLEEGSLVSYRCSTVHAPEHDRGIRWDSFGFTWPCEAPNLADRDLHHPKLAEFATPF